MINIRVIKKDGSLEEYEPWKIVRAVTKSADRVNVNIDEEKGRTICDLVEKMIADTGKTEIEVAEMHKLVEMALIEVDEQVAKSYRDYRNYKADFIHIMDEVLQMNQNIMYLADRSNANTDSSLTTTKRSLLYKKLSKELYQKTFLKPEEKQAIKDGYIYIHDISDRLHCTHNCCVVDLGPLLENGFEMSNIVYKQPKRLSTMFGVISDATLNISANQYRGILSCAS